MTPDIKTRNKIETFSSTNPATGERLGTYNRDTDHEVDDKLAEAYDTSFEWADMPVAERAQIIGRAAQLMIERKDELAQIVTQEMGKRFQEAQQEVELAASVLEYYATNGERFLENKDVETENGSAQIVYQPLGVLLGVMPWNFPYYQVARFAAPNLIAGNTILLKHASICPGSALMFEEILHDAGLERGVYTNLFITPKQVEDLLADPRVQGVSFTGSEAGGAAIAQAASKYVKKSLLELGGSDPFIVRADADIDKAILDAVKSRMANSGQSCTSSKRMIVNDAVYDEFVDGVVAALKDLTFGDPMDQDTTIAPLSSSQALDDILEQIQDTVDAGATLLAGGTRLGDAGNFLEPTVITDIRPGMRAYSEELFGPVFMIYKVENDREAIALANDSAFGLGGAIYSQDVDAAEKMAKRIDTGMVWINQPTGSRAELPFGGVKRSGYGRELSVQGIHEFMNQKLIVQE